MNQIDPGDFGKALRSVRCVRRGLLLLLTLALLATMTVFVLVEFAGILESNPQTHTALRWIMAAGKFFGVVLTGVLLVTTLLAVLLSLTGRVGAPSGFIGAFYWTLILLAMLAPWQTLLGATVACGATYNLQDLLDARTALEGGESGLVDQVFHYARFVAYPVLALLVLMMAALRFHRGYAPLAACPRADQPPMSMPGQTAG